MPELSKPEWNELLEKKHRTCAICRRSKTTFPGIKLVPDTRKDANGKEQTNVLCHVCKKGIDTFHEPAIMFQAIVYLRGGA